MKSLLEMATQAIVVCVIKKLASTQRLQVVDEAATRCGMSSVAMVDFNAGTWWPFCFWAF